MNNLKVHEMTVVEHMLVADYWSNASDSYLLALGVDKSKMPARTVWVEALTAQCAQSLSRRHNFYLGWERDGDLVGHSNVSPFEYGKSGMIHMHIWDEVNRGQGIAKICLAETMKMFFDILAMVQFERRRFVKTRKSAFLAWYFQYPGRSISEFPELFPLSIGRFTMLFWRGENV